MSKNPETLLFAYRGGIVENTISGHYVIIKNGNIIKSKGNPNLIAYTRSSSKPIQGLAIILSGAADKFRLSQKELAIMCASHAADPIHIDLVRSIMRKFKITEKMLLCGTHKLQSEVTWGKILNHRLKNSPAFNNCSGKHLGMILSARALGVSTDNYINSSHPVQRLNLHLVTLMSEARPSDIKIGVDGCGAPNFALPMKNMALAFQNLTNPGRLEPQLKDACLRITSAIGKFPQYIHGPERYDTEFMKLRRDSISKGGAEGVQCVGFKGKNLAFAMKISSGDEIIYTTAALLILKKHNIISRKEFLSMKPFSETNRYNAQKIKIGEIVLA